MNRRSFIAAGAVGSLAPLSSGLSLGAPAADAAQFLELRRYRLPYGAKQARFHDFLEHAAIPALNRLGIAPVGAFSVMYGPNEPTLFVLLPHRDIESVATLRSRLADDSQLVSDAESFLTLPSADPGHVGFESELFRAFAGMPTVEVPPQKMEGQNRIFELRRYESHAEDAAMRKIDMFNAGGELDIFRNVGLTPVFFGEALIGQKMPNLTYMLAFDDMTARDAAWRRFGQDPQWQVLRNDERYTDTVSAITDYILRPTGYSQI